MSPTAARLLEEIKRLPDEDRELLIDALDDPIEHPPAPPCHESWREVIQRRSAEMDSGAVVGIPWEVVKAEAHQHVGLDD